MKKNLLSWRQTLTELNDFSCKIEFLQCRLRKSISEKKRLNLDDYLSSLKQLMLRHQQNLKVISSNNNKIKDILLPSLELKKPIEVETVNKIYQ